MSSTRRLGLNSQTTPAASLEEFAGAAASAGFRAVECAAEILDGPVEHVAETFRRHGLEVLGVCPSVELLDWHWRWDAAIERRLDEELRRARALEADYFVLPFMRPRGDAESVRRGLAGAAPLARAAGMRLAVEPIGHFEVLNRAQDLVPVLRDQDPEVVALLLDAFHFFRAGQELDALHAYSGLPVAAIQLSNVNARAQHEALGYRDRVFPLDGRWPVREFTSLASSLFPGAPLVVEIIGDVARATPTGEAAERAHRQLAELTRTLDPLERSRG
ncbi:sugar phosphate isomerase/epimerase family protein [Agromyces aerolatus]|uniref:sugar phosphate isomerase/epimerase family protein n=1 Tax=Agromyces sp. LY-1074 TaxID=3074080 RepID=UPI00285B498B|nr:MULTISPECIES: TIM barrel protein [unclassified Agromyces]MDR5700908.1 TIM barrel protein [Agromyces sp. LY-1074]MDR5707431.1 TIM barrel protein [Agromyces sp. LY-1358]